MNYTCKKIDDTHSSFDSSHKEKRNFSTNKLIPEHQNLIIFGNRCLQTIRLQSNIYVCTYRDIQPYISNEFAIDIISIADSGNISTKQVPNLKYINYEN